MNMRNLMLFVCCILMLSFAIPSMAQNDMEGSLGLPGDNLNLYAVMKLFQESKTLEVFERDLNDENSKINNLDLNGDGKIDYITVADNFDGQAHTIVLKDAINETESQDVAVFYVGKNVNDKPQIQLIGDETLYGKDYIIEPNIGGNVKTVQTSNPGYAENQEVGVEEGSANAEASAWPLIGLLFLPSYVAWHSPFYYGYYPPYFRPWQPLYWHSYNGYHSNLNHYYKGNFHHTVHYRDGHFRQHYYSGRHVAPSVIQHKNTGFYKKTYSHPELRKEGAAIYAKQHPIGKGNDRLHSASKENPYMKKVAPVVPKTQPNGGVSSAGRYAVPRTQPNTGVSSAGRTAIPRTQPNAGLSSAGRTAVPRTQPNAGVTSTGSTAVPRTQPNAGVTSTRSTAVPRTQPNAGVTSTRSTAVPKAQPNVAVTSKTPVQPASQPNKSKPKK